MKIIDIHTMSAVCDKTTWLIKQTLDVNAISMTYSNIIITATYKADNGPNIT